MMMISQKRMNYPNGNNGLLILTTIVVYLLLLVMMIGGAGGGGGVDAMAMTTLTRSGNQPRRFIGIDLGTSGARISMIEQNNNNNNNNRCCWNEIYSHAITWNESSRRYDDPKAWIDAVEDLLRGASSSALVDESSGPTVQAICISGTSASCVLVDRTAETKKTTKTTEDPSVPRITTTPRRRDAARMYNYNVQNEKALQLLRDWVPNRHTARSSTSCLAKLLEWHVESPIQASERLCHQADFVTRHFLESDDDDETGSSTTVSDWHNCLKLGYDVQNLQWPTWMIEMFHSLGIPIPVLPTVVVSPGQPIPGQRIRPEILQKFGTLFSQSTIFVGGTTDSNAAFIAATTGGGNEIRPGTAVTSLGSTLAIKQLSERYVEDAEKGVYSHRFPSTLKQQQDSSSTACWLVGGASNVGCAILRALHFSNEELVELSLKIDPETDSPLSYYPLTTKGERFPVSDPNKEPVLEPVPQTREKFLHAILQGISDVERDGFLALGALGAVPSKPHQVWTCGGGSRNDQWTRMRQRRLRKALANDSFCVAKATNVEASYGAAILASSSFCP
jgi:xylulokinase